MAEERNNGMLRFRIAIPILVGGLIAIIVIALMASSKKPAFPTEDDIEKCGVFVENELHEAEKIMNPAVKEYAAQFKVNMATACARMALQGTSDGIGTELRNKEADTFAGMWIQHTPEYRFVFSFTRDGEKTLRPYIKGKPYADLVEVRKAKYTLKELKAAQEATGSIVRSLGISTNSGINVFENRAEVYVVDWERFEAAL